MGDMTAGIRRCNSQQVYHKCKQGQINQLDPPDQEQADLQIFPVERDGNIITGKGPGAAMEFALAVVELLQGKEKVQELKEAMCVTDL